MESAEKLSITVTPAMAKMIREKVENGSFASASEVVRPALRAFQRDEEEHVEHLAGLRARINAALDDPGPRYSGLEVREHLRDLASRLAATR
jgi:antitoxin ParD1/3/4